MLSVRAVAVALWGQWPNGSRQVYKKVEQGNRDNRMLRESLCVMEEAYVDSLRYPESNPNLLLASCVTLGILLHLWTSWCPHLKNGADLFLSGLL